MAKNVALSNDAYSTLEKLKRNGESFSDVVVRLANKEERPDWRDVAGVWKDDKEVEKVFGEILRERHKIKKRRELKW